MGELERTPSAPDVLNFEQVLDVLSEQAGAGVEPVTSRVAKRAQWATQLRWSEENRNVLQEAAGRVGSLALPEEPRHLEVEERNALMEEALVIRDLQDRVQGRYDAIRGAVFSVLDLDAPEQEGVLAAPGLNKKFVREYRGKPSIDWRALIDILPPKLRVQLVRVRTVTTVVRSLTGDEISRGETTEHIVDEEAALQAVKSGDLPLDLIAQAVIPAKKTSYFTIRDMTPEDLSASPS